MPVILGIVSGLHLGDVLFLMIASLFLYLMKLPSASNCERENAGPASSNKPIYGNKCLQCVEEYILRLVIPEGLYYEIDKSLFASAVMAFLIADAISHHRVITPNLYLIEERNDIWF